MKNLNGKEVRPFSLDAVIGQRSVIETVRVALAAVRNDNSRFEHSLLVGPPGLGKTQISQVIGEEMGSGYREVLAQTLQSPNDVNGLILASKEKGVILLDEIHEADPGVQTYLFQFIDSRKLTLQSNRKVGGPPLEVKAPDVTLLLATTDEYGVLAPLRMRCRLTLRFDFYSPEDLADISFNRAKALRWPLESPSVAGEIARRSRGTPRIALSLLQSAYRMSRSRNAESITARDLYSACDLEGIDGYGLGPLDRKYMEVLTNGPTGLNFIASRLGIHSRTVEQVVEPYLFRMGWVAKGVASKRFLTQQGTGVYGGSRE